MTAYIADFIFDDDTPPTPEALSQYHDRAVLYVDDETWAKIPVGSEVLFYLSREGVVGRGRLARKKARGWVSFDDYQEPKKRSAALYTIQELKDARVSLPTWSNPVLPIGALAYATLEDLRRATKADIAAERAELERQRALVEVALRPEQTRFAAQVRKNWRDRCPLSGLSSVFCEAAHIVDFALCDDEETADPDNGILLAAHLHKAFDAHLFTINPDGEIEWSERLPAADRKALERAKTPTQIDVTPRMRPYLERRFAQAGRTAALG